nr:aspartyl protease family protein [Pelobium sp.]
MSLILCTALIAPIFAQNTFHFKGKKQKELIKFTKARGLIVVSTYINNKGPYNFILDSGVGLIVITDPSLKDSLHLKYLRKFEIKGLGEGRDIDAFLTPFLKIEIGSTIAESAAAAVLDKDIFDLSTYAGMPIHGLIGYEFFQSFLIRIYYESGFLMLYKNEKSRLIRKGYRVPITIEQNKPYLNVLVDIGDKKKIPLKMIIDTGAGHPIALESNDGSSFPLPDKFIAANLGIGLGGNIGGFIGRIDNFKIGKFDLKNPICSFPYYEDVGSKVTSIIRNGSIGNQLLKRFEIIFDYERHCIYLKPNTSFSEPFEHDMSGIELYAAGDDFKRFFVNRIEPQSPADEFGLQKDDEILSINFKPASQMSFDEITDLLKSKEGRNLYIEVQRGKETLRGILTLQRRI